VLAMTRSMDSNIPKSEPIEEAAVRWFTRQQSGAWNEAEQASLDAWLEENVAHRIQYLRIKHVWDKTDSMKALGAGVPAGAIPPRGSWGDKRFLRGGGSVAAAPRVLSHDGMSAKPRPRIPFFAAAAALLVLAGSIYLFYAGLFAGTRYSTPVGGIQTVALADGSQATLNTDTSLRVILGDRERQIRLNSGEAFFEVAKDSKRPFVVYVDNKRVMAVGTKFAVRRNNDDVQVVVTEGRVKLDHSSGESSPPVAFLDAGTIARTSKSEVMVRRNVQSEAEKLLSWRIGYVSFDNVPLGEAAVELNRYNARKIVIDDPAIAALRIGGNFRSNNTDAFLDLLQSGFPIAVEQREHEVILRAR